MATKLSLELNEKKTPIAGLRALETTGLDPERFSYKKTGDYTYEVEIDDDLIPDLREKISGYFDITDS